MAAPEPVSSTSIAPAARTGGSASRVIFWGTLAAGVLDICGAMLSVQWRGIPAVQAIKGVAAGWLGREAFAGGAGVIALGLVTHFGIMAVIVAIYHAAHRALPALGKRWILVGAAYGAAVHSVMTFVVVPLSAFPSSGPPSLAAFLEHLVIQIVCVGLPIAYVVRRLAPRDAS